MKAVLLAGGLGTRLRPLTDTVPKCLVPIGGRPLLDIWLDALAPAGVDEVLVNTHHLAPLVRAHVAGRTGGPLVHLAHEPELLGSAGTLRSNRAFLESEDRFLVINADNLTDLDPAWLLAAHRRDVDATLAVFRSPRPSECGIVSTGADGIVTGFAEKPAVPTSDLANAGLYVFTPAVLDLVPDLDPVDVGTHLLPELVGRSRAVALPDGTYFLDVGTPVALRRARAYWEVMA